jgi:Arylsulfotransferase (ASST)
MIRRSSGAGAVLALTMCSGSARAAVDVFPSAGTRAASPLTQISFRGATPSRLRHVTITGSRTGRHAFKVKEHSDGRGASLLPARSFRAGELVTVRAALSLTGARRGVIRFRVARFASHLPSIYFPDPVGTPKGVQHFHSDHALRPPRLMVRRRAGITAPGDLFLAPKGGPGQNGPMITDDSGRLIWFRPLGDGTAAFDFRVQQYRSRPVLTWWQGRVRSPGEGAGVGLILDSSYRTIARVRAGNGYQADLHEFELTPQGTALLLAYQPVRWHRALVTDVVVQEIDIATGLVEFEWHSLGHIHLSESYAPRTPDGPYDYIHANSTDLEPDGNLLVSGRATHAIYELDRHSGNVLWRLGGKRSDFKMSPGSRFVAQHDARRAPDGTITIFDNGAPPVTRRRARGIVLSLDMAAHTAALVRSFTHSSPAWRSANQGSLQTLTDGHYLVYWGSHSWLSEYDANGSLVLDAHFEPAADDSYRAYRLAWQARPAAAPRIEAASSHGATMVWASWNGATSVASWQVLAGDARGSLSPVASAAWSGFETGIGLHGTPRYVEVKALGAEGAVLATSSVVKPSRRG